jgi:hypothetical protein
VEGNVIVAKRCASCGQPVVAAHASSEPCPHCFANAGYVVVKTIDETLELRESIQGSITREYFEKHDVARWVLRGVGVAGVALSLTPISWLGLAGGVAAFIVSDLWGHKAIVKVREQLRF